MAGNRKAATDWLVNFVDELVPNSPNGARIRRELEGLTDEQFEALMVDFENGEDWPSIIIPTGAKYDISVERNLAIG